MFNDEVLMGADADDLGKPVRPKTPDQQLREYLKTLTPEARRDYLANLRGGPQQRAANMYDWRGEGLVRDASIASTVAHIGQGRMLNNMAQQTTGAIQSENDRRVAISREMRRMQHEQDLERMRQETERRKIDVLLARLNNSRPDGSMAFSHDANSGWRAV